jgi:hypothetical protein
MMGLAHNASIQLTLPPIKALILKQTLDLQHFETGAAIPNATQLNWLSLE